MTSPHEGPKGWLRLLVHFLTWIYPTFVALSYGMIALGWMQERPGDSGFARLLVVWVIAAALMSCGLYLIAGLVLAAGQTRVSLRLAIGLLWLGAVAGPVGVSLLSVGMLDEQLAAPIANGLPKALASGCFWCLLWSAYLLRSRRVAATYPARGTFGDRTGTGYVEPRL